jgi:hypothetical protein
VLNDQSGLYADLGGQGSVVAAQIVFRRGVSTMIGVGVPSSHLAKSMA